MRGESNDHQKNRVIPATRQRQRFLEAALASVADGVIIVDAEWRIVFVNQAGNQLMRRVPNTEVPLDEQVGVLNLRYLDRRPMPLRESPLGRALRGETLVDFHFVFAQPDGSDVNISSTASPVRDEDSRIVGAVAVFRDVTGSKRAELERERLLEQLQKVNEQLVVTSIRAKEQADAAQRRATELETIIDSLADGVFLCNKDGHIVDVNKAGLQLIGVGEKETPQRTLVDYLRLLNLRHPNGRPLAMEEMALARALEGEVVRNLEEIAQDLRTRRDINLLVSASPVRNREGEIVGAVEIVSDITRIRELDKLKDEFISVAAHELKTPVAIMKGYAQALLRLDKEMTVDRRRMLEAINRGAGRIDRIVKDLLDISRLHLGRLTMLTEKIDLSDMVDEVVARMALTTNKHRFTVVRTETALIQGDRERLEQALISLLDNAIKYSPQGGEVLVAIDIRDREAVVSVRDTGIGIPKEKQADIFQPFYRAHTGTPYDYGGMGVGLYISREIITRHGGKMWFESEEDKGSTFYFSLPLA